MHADGYLFETLAITVPITVVLWWLWLRWTFKHTRKGRIWLSFATAFLVAPTFMAPYGQWNVYPAWCIFIHILFASPVAVFVFCVGPILAVASIVYALSSHFHSPTD
jgi:hypothetical protein